MKNSHTRIRVIGAVLLTPVLMLAAVSCSKTKGGSTGEADSPYGTGPGGYDDVTGGTPLPSRNENVSFSGPGSENVNRELFSPVYFAFDSSTIRPSEMAKIDAVAEFAKSDGGSNSIIIGGFTDSIGTEEYNRQLGEFRALSVRSELLRRGIHPNRVQTVSFGEDMPAVAAGTMDANAANRRAEFGIVQ